MSTRFIGKDYVRICLCNMLLFFSFQMMLPTIPVYLRDSGGDQSQIGAVISIITFAAVLIRLFTGYALDHWNRKVIVAAGSIVFVLAAAAYPFYPLAGWMIGCSIWIGIGWGILTVSYATLVSDLIPPGRQGAGIGTFMLFAMASMAAGPFAGGWIYGRFGSAVLFGTASLIALLSLLLFLSGKSANANASSPQPTGKKPALLSGILERSSLFPAALLMLYTFCYGGIISFAGLYGQALGVANSGLFFLLSSAASMLVRPVAASLFDTKGHPTVLVPGIVLGIIALFALSAAAGPMLYIIASVLYGLSFGSVQPYLLAWTMQRARPDRRGAASSTFLIGMDSGIALGSIALGIWSGAIGYATMFRGSGVILVCLLAIYSISLFHTGRLRHQAHTGRAESETG
ncbi:MFS transporter [Paenibacillus alkalitolerans]|uniref:MFS transporter n=1 Tax=Paenibacillus alkalitolerans TaxID=2799335 RepID=UPI0018F38205|nr:MFS transporter [Paenibacillus alkalitolerans]